MAHIEDRLTNVEQFTVETYLTIEHFTLSDMSVCLITLKHAWTKPSHHVVKLEDIEGKSGKQIVSKLQKMHKVTHFVVPKESYWNHYFKRQGFTPSSGKDLSCITDIDEIRELLIEGKSDRFVEDKSSYDGWFRDIDGNPIPRKYHFDYITGFKGTLEELTTIEAKLKKDKRATNVSMLEIPYYNSEFTGQMGLEFWYNPTKKEIKLLIGSSYKGQMEIKKRWCSE